jgi:hypothetical protein
MLYSRGQAMPRRLWASAGQRSGMPGLADAVAGSGGLQAGQTSPQKQLTTGLARITLREHV